MTSETYHLRCTECGAESEKATRRWETCPVCYGSVEVVA